MRKYLLLFVLGLCLASCTSKKEVIYFQKEVSEVTDASEYSTVIKRNDRLRITVTAEDMRVVQPYNLTMVGGANIEADPLRMVGQQRLIGYLVNSDGYINFPTLGRIKVAGMTKIELENFLYEQIADSVKDPVVDVRILNYQVTVLGEVNRPGTFTISGERISLLQAIGLAGDLTIYGKRDRVLIIRDDVDGRTTHRVDLTDSDLLNSEHFFLKQNDIVVVEPNSAQIASSDFNRNAQVYVSVASLLISVIIILSNRN